MRVERISLPSVDLHCHLEGEGDTVILAHGFPDEPMTFAGTARALVSAGFRVVLPTMRGYAPSSEAKDGIYDPAALGDDLVALARAVSPDRPVHLVGHDWGAIAAFSAAAAAPEVLATLTTISVPHFAGLLPHFRSSAQLGRSWYIGLFQTPWLAERTLRKDDLAFVDRLYRDWSPGYEPTADELDAVKAAIRPRVPAVLAYYRALGSPRALAGASRARMFARVTVPALHVHGADDGCFGIECCEGAEAHYDADYRFVRVEGAGHFVTREQPEALTRALLSRYGRPSVRPPAL
jgi:pimeloyl-ACP methyl ester carboxylesterase